MSVLNRAMAAGAAFATVASLALVGCGGGGGVVAGGLHPVGTTSIEGLADDTVLAHWTIGSKSGDVLFQELPRATNREGKEIVPPVDTIMERTRVEILGAEAENQGIKVSEEDELAYVTEDLGYADLEMLSTDYGVDEATAKAIAHEGAMAKALGLKLANIESGSTKRPEMPANVEVEGSYDDSEAFEKALAEAQSKPSDDYLKYIKDLAGKSWDDKDAGWQELVKSESGATYDEAMAAYEKAWTAWNEEHWNETDSVNAATSDVLAKATVNLATATMSY